VEHTNDFKVKRATQTKAEKAKDIDFIRHFCSESLGVKIVIDEITRLGAKPKRGSGKHSLTRIKVCDSAMTMRGSLFRNA